MTIEDTVVKAKELLNTAGEKVDTVISVQKIKFGIASVKSQISKDYKILGELYYSGIKNENVDPDALQAIIDEIDTEKDKLREMQAELAFAKGNSVCDECGAVNSRDADYCSKCGKAING